MQTPHTNKPNPEYTTDAGDTLKMTYFMFSDIMRLLGNDPDDSIALLMTHPDTRDFVMRRLFTDLRKPVETLDELINPYDINISPLELDGIIAWVADHVMHFTMSTAEKTRPVLEKYKAQAEAKLVS